MCGIAGLFHPGTPKPVDPARIAAMIAVQAHRGPDGDGVWTAPGVGLGHRRLSIIDLEGSPQPMHAGALSVTYNGEIYNFAELRAQLERGGARFVTDGDTEVLLHGWRAWGPGLLDRLNGMFAFAIHDAEAGTLFLARDRLGVKPLHYVELSDGSLAFASELKGLLAHPLLRRVPDATAIEDYLAFGYACASCPRAIACWCGGGKAYRRRANGGTSASPTGRPALRARSARSCWRICARACAAAWSPTCRLVPSCPVASIVPRSWR
jgi:asparagine synthase (glutamine-hydrolysing)